MSTSSSLPSVSSSQPAIPLGASPGQQKGKELKRTMCPGHQGLGNRMGKGDNWSLNLQDLSLLLSPLQPSHPNPGNTRGWALCSIPGILTLPSPPQHLLPQRPKCPDCTPALCSSGTHPSPGSALPLVSLSNLQLLLWLQPLSARPPKSPPFRPAEIRRGEMMKNGPLKGVNIIELRSHGVCNGQTPPTQT